MGLSNTAASSYGDSAVAAIGVATRIMALGNYVVFGFEQVICAYFLHLEWVKKAELVVSGLLTVIGASIFANFK